MCAVKVIPTSTSTPALDLKKLNQAESLQLLTLAIQKYPKFAKDVSTVIEGTESRIRREATEKFYDNLVDKLCNELQSGDDIEEWERHQYVDRGEPNGNVLAGVLKEIGRSVNNQTSDEYFEFAFKALMRCCGCIMEAEQGRDEEEYFCLDLEVVVDDAKSAVKEMALLWMKKGGRVSKDRHRRILKLLEDDSWIDADDFRDDLDDELEGIEDEEEEEEEKKDEEEEKEEEGEEGEEEDNGRPQLKRIRIE